MPSPVSDKPAEETRSSAATPTDRAPGNVRAPKGSRTVRLLSWLVVIGPILALVWPLATGHSFWLRDILRHTYPLKFYLRERLLAGELPLWNPRMGLGRPFLGEVHPGVFDPLGVLVLLPAPFGVDLYSATHLFIAAIGTRQWLRALGHEPYASSAGGILLALSGYFVSVLSGNGVYAYGVAFVPWILLQMVHSAEDVMRRAQIRRALIVALLFAWALASGDPMAVYFGGGCALAQCIGRNSRTERLRALTVLGGAALAFVPLTVAQWLPALDVVRVARPSGVPFVEASHFAFHPVRLLEFVWPGSFGAPHSPQWFVHPLYAEGTGRLREPWAAGIYVGLVTWPLAIYAIASSKRRAIDIAFGTLALLALVTAMGRHTPLWWLVYHAVPGARLFRYPEMYLFLTTLGVVPLAVRGFELAFEQPARTFRASWVWLTSLVVAALVAPLLAAPIAAIVGNASVDAVRTTLIRRAWVAVAIATVVILPLFALVRGKVTPSTARLLVAIVWVADILWPARGLTQFAPSSIYAQSPFARALLAAIPPAERETVRLYRPAAVDLATDDNRAVLEARSLQPNSGMADGIGQLDAYQIYLTPREALLWSSFANTPLRMLQLSGTRYALLADTQLGPHGGGLRIIAHDRRTHAALVEVPGVAPRVFLAADVTSVADEHAAVRAMLQPEFAPGRSAVVEGGAAGVTNGTCRTESYRPDRIEIECESQAASYVIVNDLRFDGWTATVNGARAEILPADVTMRAVPVPAGTARVVMRYAPRGWPWALWVSLASVVGCVGVVAGLRRKH